jgi:hypothetical protein
MYTTMDGESKDQSKGDGTVDEHTMYDEGK